MKAELNTQQEQRLIELGLIQNHGEGTLVRLLEILPKEIKGKYGLTPIVITFGGIYGGEGIDGWFAYYDDVIETLEINADELIDALYELTVWYIENKHLKL